MAKQKERSELECLRAENKNLKSQVKYLKKQVSRSDKRKSIVDDMEATAREHLLEIETECIEIKERDSCPACSKGVEKADLGKWWLVTCDHCDFRKRIKK